MYEQKDIVLMPFPYSDLTGSKQRPALIISNEKLSKSQDRICCLITSNETDEGILIEKSAIMGKTLPFKSWVKPHRIFTINEQIITKKLCSVDENFHHKIIKVISELIK